MRTDREQRTENREKITEATYKNESNEFLNQSDDSAFKPIR